MHGNPHAHFETAVDAGCGIRVTRDDEAAGAMRVVETSGILVIRCPLYESQPHNQSARRAT
jgi:hypothetical protein